MTPWGRLYITWLDLWTMTYGLEVCLGRHRLLDVGFSGVRP